MKYFYFVFGLLCFVLGAIGVILPLLPATPFLLAASFCFVRSSKRIHKWLLQTPLYQQHLNQLITTGQMTRKSKIIILAFVTPFLLAAFFLMSNLLGRIAIIILLLLKYYVLLFLIRTAPKANKPPRSLHSLTENRKQS